MLALRPELNDLMRFAFLTTHGKGFVHSQLNTLIKSLPTVLTRCRQRVGVASGDILDVINAWPEDRRQRAYDVIAEIEEQVGHATCMIDCPECLVKSFACAARSISHPAAPLPGFCTICIFMS